MATPSLSDQHLYSNPYWEPTVLRDARFDVFQRRVKTVPCSWGLLGNLRFLVRRKLLGDLVKISSFTGPLGESGFWRSEVETSFTASPTTRSDHCSGSADSSGPFGQLTTQGHTRAFGNLFLSRESVILFSKLWVFFPSLHSWWTWALFYKKNDSILTHTVFTAHLFFPELIGALFISSTYPRKKKMMGRTEDFLLVLLLLNFTDIQQNAYSTSFFSLRHLSIKLSSSSKLNTY